VSARQIPAVRGPEVLPWLALASSAERSLRTEISSGCGTVVSEEKGCQTMSQREDEMMTWARTIRSSLDSRLSERGIEAKAISASMSFWWMVLVSWRLVSHWKIFHCDGEYTSVLSSLKYSLDISSMVREILANSLMLYIVNLTDYLERQWHLLKLRCLSTKSKFVLHCLQPRL